MFASARRKPSCVCLQIYVVFFQRKTDIEYRLMFSVMRYILKDVKKVLQGRMGSMIEV